MNRFFLRSTFELSKALTLCVLGVYNNSLSTPVTGVFKAQFLVQQFFPHNIELIILGDQPTSIFFLLILLILVNNYDSCINFKLFILFMMQLNVSNYSNKREYLLNIF